MQAHAQEQPRQPERSERPRPQSAKPAEASNGVVIAPPSDGLAAQLQRSVRERTPAAPLLQRYHRFKSSPGTGYAGYKIVNLEDETFGRYHVKWHPIESLDAYDELHVKFDDQSWADAEETLHWPYFYFRDDGTVIASKSKSGRNRIPDAEAVATEAVKDILDGSQPIPAQTFATERAAMLQAKAEHEQQVQAALAAAALVEQQRLAAEAALAEEQRKTAEKSQDELTHIENFLTDIKANPGERNALRPYIQGPAGDLPGAPWLKGKGDWYRDKKKANWQLSLGPVRSEKAPKPDAFKSADLPEGVRISSIAKGERQSSRAWHWNAKAELLNYTLFSKTNAGKVEVAALK